MHIFKDTVALEECPAKTAESVSYGAVFTVLTWLLVSNYSGGDHSNIGISTIDNTDLPLINEAPPAVIFDTQLLNKTQSKVLTLKETDKEAEVNNFASKALVWHTEIEQFERHSHLRVYSASTWATQTNDPGRQIEGLIADLDWPLPIIDSNYLLNAKRKPDPIIIAVLASNQPAKDELASEIPVTGTEIKRLSSRPDEIQRPQIPRPSRGQELKRSFVRPPRIQAFKP